MGRDRARVMWLVVLSAILVAVSTWKAGAVFAAEVTVTVCPDCAVHDLQSAVAAAPPGATVVVRGGRYAGPLVIDRPLTVIGVGQPVVDGAGRGSVVTIAAPDVRLEGLVIRGSGTSHDREDSAIVVTAPRVVIEDNQVLDSLFGIYLKEAPDALVQGNRVVGLPLPEPVRGDGLKVWYSPRAQIVGNEIEDIRDVLLWFSDDAVVRDNVVRRARYGLHVMYSQGSLIEGNRIEHNSVGIYLMYGGQQIVRRNVLAWNRGPSGYGLAVKETDGLVAEANLIHGNRVGIYVDNSPLSPRVTNLIKDNWVAYNDVGLQFTPATQRNVIVGNSLIENLEQVTVQSGGTVRELVWAEDGRGNFWSDYAGYDADGDGIGDIPYRREELFRSLAERYPLLAYFRFSLAAAAVDLAARAVPVFRPLLQLVDPAPLVRPGAWPGIEVQRTTSGTSYAVLALFLLSAGILSILAPRMVWAMPAARAGVLAVASGPRRRPSASGWQAGHLQPRVLAETAQPDARRETTDARDQSQPEAVSAFDTTPMIAVHRLRKRYGRHTVIDGLSFTVHRGEAVALWGPNGAGKTTVLRCLLGVTAYEGEVRIAGQSPVSGGARVRGMIGYVPQQLPVLDMTVGELLATVSALRHVPVDHAWELLESFGLGQTWDTPTRALSGGMQQKLALTVALIGDPPLLLLDEPTASLDAAARRDVLERLRSLRDAGRTIVFTSHRQEEVWHLATRVVRLGEQASDALPGTVSDGHRGQRYVIGLDLDEESAAAAYHLLVAHGMTVYRAGRRLRVVVEPNQKGIPFFLLGQAGICVRDFALEDAYAW